MRARSRLSLLAAVAIFAAVSGDSAPAAGSRTTRPAKSWRKSTGQRRAVVQPRKARRVQSIARARRPRVVATAASAHHPALGFAGPLGPFGPLGRLGPVIDTAWSPARWMRAVGEWSQLSAILTKLGGPLGEGGPLGPGGPQGIAHDRFSPSLVAGGSMSAVGPDGALGALGPLGPLGPMGAHGFARDPRGRYLAGAAVQRSVTVPYQGGSRSYPLFEVYDADFAAGMPDNDTSFMAVGDLGRGKTDYDFSFHSGGGEHVQIVLTPHARLDRFRLEILDGAGNLIATSDQASQINRVELWVPARTRLKARVSLAASGHLLPDKPFSLTVVGKKKP